MFTRVLSYAENNTTDGWRRRRGSLVVVGGSVDGEAGAPHTDGASGPSFRKYEGGGGYEKVYDDDKTERDKRSLSLSLCPGAVDTLQSRIRARPAGQRSARRGGGEKKRRT